MGVKERKGGVAMVPPIGFLEWRGRLRRDIKPPFSSKLKGRMADLWCPNGRVGTSNSLSELEIPNSRLHRELLIRKNLDIQERVKTPQSIA